MSDLHHSLGVMVDDIQTSIRQTSFTEDGSYKPKALWWEFTAFQHTGVPSCQSIGDSLDTENEGSVPGNSYTVSPSSEFWMVPLINRLTMALFPVPHHMAPWGPVHACPVSCRLEPGHLGPSWFAWQDLAASQKLHGATRVDQQEGLRGSCLLSHTLMTFSCMLLKNCSSMQEDGLMEGRLGSWPSGKGLRGCSNSIVSCPDILLSKIAPWIPTSGAKAVQFNIFESVQYNKMHALWCLNELSKTLLQILVSWSHDQADKENMERDKICYLLTLLTELLLNITSYLPVLPEACLALTCKWLLTICHLTLLSDSSDFNQEFMPLLHHYQNSYNFNTPWWQFITLLENNRWKACLKCLKWHWTTSFSTWELKCKSEDWTCHFGNTAGIVDLCPCIKLTYNDKMELIELLERRKESIAVLVTLFGSHVSWSFSWHCCTKTYGSTELKIEILPELDESNRCYQSIDREKLGEIGRLRTSTWVRALVSWLMACQRLPKNPSILW